MRICVKMVAFICVFLAALMLPRWCMAQSCLTYYLDCQECGGSLQKKMCCIPSGCLPNEIGNGSCTNPAKCYYTCNGHKEGAEYSCAGTLPANETSASGHSKIGGEPCLVEGCSLAPRTDIRRISFVQPPSSANSASAFEESGSAGQQPQGLNPADVQVSIPPGVPLKVTGVQATPIPDGYARVDYNVVNMGTQRLVALQIAWKLTFANSQTYPAVQTADYFFDAGGALAPGATSGTLELGQTESTTTGPLTRASATLAYAEFSDGTQYGSAVRDASRSFANSWAKCMRYYHQALTAYQSGGVAALNQAMSWRQQPAEGDGRTAWINLHQIEDQKGMPGVIDELVRISKLQIPGQ